MVVNVKSAALGLVLIGAWGAIAFTHPALAMHPSPTHDTNTPEPHRAIEQPLAVKVGVTLAGLGLIGMELWWFLLSRKGSNKLNS